MLLYERNSDEDRRAVFCLQAAGSQVSLSDMTCSQSASSFQSVSHTSTPEILVGLVYNATTGRLSVEIIKGVHFKNLAANKPPSKSSQWLYSISLALLLILKTSHIYEFVEN